MKCHNCGHQLTAGAPFCGNCGTPTAQSVPASQQAAQQPYAPTPGHIPASEIPQPTYQPPQNPINPQPQPYVPVASPYQPNATPSNYPQPQQIQQPQQMQQMMPPQQTMQMPSMPGPANPFAGQASNKSYFTTFLFAFFLGFFGVDRFYTEQIGLGVAKLLFSWATIGLWPFIDVILILTGVRKDKFGRALYGREKDLKVSMIVFGAFIGLIILLSIGISILSALSGSSN